MKRCIRKVKLVICKTNKQKDHLGEEIINHQVYYKLQPPPYVRHVLYTWPKCQTKLLHKLKQKFSFTLYTILKIYH